MEKEGCPERFIFGFEESCGYLSGTDVRDKDGVNAALLLCEMAAGLKAERKTLLTRLDELRAEFGFFAQRLLTFQYDGKDGARRMAALMENLRRPLDELRTGSLSLSARTDYLLDDTGLPKSDVLEFILSEGEKFVVRPSGTEPKLKAYLFARGTDQVSAETALDLLESSVRSLCELRL